MRGCLRATAMTSYRREGQQLQDTLGQARMQEHIARVMVGQP